jgi:hypothetical protein
VKPCISCNGCKNIPNDIMGYNPLPTMGTIEEVDSPKGLIVGHICNGSEQESKDGEA